MELEPGEKFRTRCGTPAEGVSAPQTPAAPPTSQESDSPYLVEDCDGGCRIRKYTGPEEGAVVIPPCIDGKKVVEIGGDAFHACEKLTIVTPAGSAAERYAENNGIAVRHM